MTTQSSGPEEDLDVTRAETPESKARERAGRTHRIGRYVLGELLGEGGMGEVYAAEQYEPVRRSVALKVIHSGRRSSERIVARFELERQVLALLEHPNIAQLLDAGLTDDGAPYFVMERVFGVPITHDCDGARRTVRERLLLFLDVCRAIEHAHRKGILHRDIKPSNVLVAEVDGHPVPKVIDFGVAKATEGALAIEGQPTQLGIPIGTLTCASPEQLDPERAANVDTRTDVYALGILLYQLLAGVSPFGEKRPTVLLDRILRGEPTPITRAVPTTDEGQEIAAARRTDVYGLVREISGDLQWIVGKAIELKPDDRYAAVSELRADIERYLADRPVLASPPSLGSQIMKFVRRNRLAVAAVVLVTLTLLGGIVATSLALLRSQEAEARAAREATKAKAVAEFLNQMLAAPSPFSDGSEIRIVEVLDRASAELDKKFAAQPEIVATLRKTLLSTYDGLGLPDKALAEAERAVASARVGFGEHHAETAFAIGSLAYALSGVGRLDEALKTFDDALHRLDDRTLGIDLDDPRRLEILESKAATLSELLRSEEALAIFTDLVPRYSRALGPDSRKALEAEVGRAHLLERTKRLTESEVAHRAIIERIEKILGPDDAARLVATNNFALVLTALEKFDEADQVMRELAVRQERVFGTDHPEMLTTQHNRVRNFMKRGDWQAAEPICRITLAARRRVLGDDHPHTIYSRVALGQIALELGHREEAAAILPEAARMAEKVLGPDHATTKRAKDSLARLQGQPTS